MRARSVMPLLLFAVLFAGGCQQAQQVAPNSHESDIKALRDVQIAEEQAWSSKDMEKVLSFYADDIKRALEPSLTGPILLSSLMHQAARHNSF